MNEDIHYLWVRIDNALDKIGNVNTNEEVDEIKSDLEAVKREMTGLDIDETPLNIPDGYAEIVEKAASRGYVTEVSMDSNGMNRSRGIGTHPQSNTSFDLRYDVHVEIVASFTEREIREANFD